MNAGTVTGQSGLLAQLGTSVQWQARYVGDGYVFSPADDPSKYLAAAESSGSSSVELISATAETIPSRCIWTVRYASGGGCLYQNVYNSRYLTTDGTIISTTTSIGTSGTELYRSSTWRTASTSFYGATSEHGHRELDSSFTVDRLVLDIGDTSTITINKSPSNATWADRSDFTYSLDSAAYVSVNQETGAFTALASGSTHVTATHKVTGLSKQFWVIVNKKAIIVLPGIMGSELESGPGNMYLEGTDLWSTDLFNDMSNGILDALTGIGRIRSLECNSDGNSINNVVVKSDGYGVFDTYRLLCEALTTEFSDRYDIKFFAYDWRMSNMDTALLLNQYIYTNQYDKVVLVAHSMGGLVASAYLSLGTTAQEKVETLITLGSPLLGTPTIPHLWASEAFLEILDLYGRLGIAADDAPVVDNLWRLFTNFSNPLDSIIHGFESIYEMFPSEYYFDSGYGNSTYLFYQELFEDYTWVNYVDTMAVLGSNLPRYDIDLGQRAEEFHHLLYVNGEHVTSLVDSHYLYVTDVPTKNQFRYDGAVWYVHAETSLGDSLVEVCSATLGERYTNASYGFSTSEAGLSSVDHADMVSNAIVIAKIKAIISGEG